MVASCCTNRCGVLLEATAAPADPTPEKLLTEPVSRCGRLGDLVGVNAELFADVPEIVDRTFRDTAFISSTDYPLN